MKILLIYPYFLEERPNSEDVQVPPIGLYWVASILIENGYKVELLNWYDVYKTPHLVEHTLRSKNPDVVGLSVLHGNRWGGIEIAHIAKRVNPKVTVVMGGVGASFLWRHILTHFEDVDYVVIGEGEYSLLGLIRNLESGKQPLEVPGLAFRNGKGPTRTIEAPRIEDLDSLPIPAKYFSYKHLTLSRGCPWDCSFCGSPSIWKRRVTMRSASHFLEEIELLYGKGIRFLYISDDTFTIDKEKVIEICKEIVKRRLAINWVAISRVDLVDEEVLYWMRKAGCIQISYGVESGSERIRRVLNKRLDPKQIEKAFDLSRRFGILPRAYFIYGSPGENWDTIRESVELIKRIKPLSIVTYILDLFPGTRLWDDFLRRTGANDDIWLKLGEDIMYFETDPSLSKELVMAFGAFLRREFYKTLPAFCEDIKLIDREELYPLHADFLSRLGMTFAYGDYQRIEDIPNKDDIAEKLFRRALRYFPDRSAFLGLAVLYQRNNHHDASVALLKKAVEYYPEDEHLNICLGISYKALGKYREAISHLMPYGHSLQAMEHALHCFRMLGDKEGERVVLERLKNLTQSIGSGKDS